MSKNGLILVTPTTVDKTGGSSTATISANGSVEFSACATLRLNGVFSADYDNYLVVMRFTDNHTTTMIVRGRYSSSGVDNDTTNAYVTQLIDAQGSSVTGFRSTETSCQFFYSNQTLRSGGIINIYGPYLAQPTAARSVAVRDPSGATLTDFASTHNQSTSYDGVNFICSAATISGRVAVYGMRK